MFENNKKLAKIMVFGTFDHLHKGHLSYFKQAKKHGGYLIVVVARDINVQKIKNHLPKQNEEERLKAVAKCGLTDEAHLGSLKNKMQIIKKLRPDVIALGYDQKADIKKIRTKFPDIRVVRLKAYQPNVYKSSLLLSFPLSRE